MRIVVADDRQAVRSALRLRLEQEQGLSVVGEAENAAELQALLVQERPDVVLLDWELLADAYMLQELLQVHSGLRVVALSSRPEARAAALSAGAAAFVSKGAPPEQLLRTIRSVGGDGIDEQKTSDSVDRGGPAPFSLSGSGSDDGGDQQPPAY
jgi:DNA-binding NarL/FixJ family response regulator